LRFWARTPTASNKSDKARHPWLIEHGSNIVIEIQLARKDQRRDVLATPEPTGCWRARHVGQRKS